MQQILGTVTFTISHHFTYSVGNSFIGFSYCLKVDDSEMNCLKTSNRISIAMIPRIRKTIASNTAKAKVFLDSISMFIEQFL